jgi:hypothetical protein
MRVVVAVVVVVVVVVLGLVGAVERVRMEVREVGVQVAEIRAAQEVKTLNQCQLRMQPKRRP